MYKERPVIRTCRKTGKKTEFKSSAFAAKSIGVNVQKIYRMCYGQNENNHPDFEFRYKDEGPWPRTENDIREFYAELRAEGYIRKNDIRNPVGRVTPDFGLRVV